MPNLIGTNPNQVPTNGMLGTAAFIDAPNMPVSAPQQVSLDTKVDKVAGKGLSTEDYTTAEKTKLAGVAAGATANSTDAQLRDRATHTGTQAISTVSGLQAALDGKAAAIHGHTIADVSGLQAALDGTVKTAGNQYISGEKNFTSTVKATSLYMQAQATERQIGWEFSDRVVYFYGQPADMGVGMYDTVGGIRFTIDKFNNFAAAGNVTAYSDIRLKTDLTKIEGALGKVCALNGYTYTRKDTGERQTGVVAQEVQKVLPEAVVDNGETLSVAYGNMVGLLIEAIKELKSEMDQMKGK